MKKKKNTLKLNKKVVFQLTGSKISGGGTSNNCPSAGGSCFINCNGSKTGCLTEFMECYGTAPGICS